MDRLSEIQIIRLEQYRQPQKASRHNKTEFLRLCWTPSVSRVDGWVPICQTRKTAIVFVKAAAHARKETLETSLSAFTGYVLLKTESLSNAIQEFSLA